MLRELLRRIKWRSIFVLRLIGYDPTKTVRFITGVPFYLRDLRTLRKQNKNNDKFIIYPRLPILDERYSDAGKMSGDYFHQDLLVAQRIYKNNPIKHLDIGSRIDGFVAHVAVFREIEIMDIRPQNNKVKNIVFKQLDLTGDCSTLADYCDSVSSLHSIEHFGLGRYGDPINILGHVKAVENIYKMLKMNGKCYISVPIGKQRIEFNAHRVFDVKYMLGLFDGKFRIDCFSYVNDQGDLFENVELAGNDFENNYGCKYGCGIFEMTKI